MDSLQLKIKQRLQNFIEKDEDGVRSNILCVFLNSNKLTIDDLYSIIATKYNISRNSIASLVGYIQSKLGIIQSYKKDYKSPTVYYLKEKYAFIIKLVLKQKFTTV